MRRLVKSPSNSRLANNIGASKCHESAQQHVTGSAVYVDDRKPNQDLLYAAVGTSPIAHGKLISVDLSALQSAEGVIAVVRVDDIPGQNDIGPVFPGDLVFAKDKVEFVGQAIFAVAATSQRLARKAVQLAKIKYQELPAILTITEAFAQQHFVRPSYRMKRGNAAKAIEQAQYRLKGAIKIGGQEHFYLEGQVSIAEPLENNEMLIYSSSQHPSEVQKLVAEVLDLPLNKITLETRRMGGAFGGKETQAAPWACIAAILAQKTQRAVKLRLNRVDDMAMTGKRHPFENSYEVGFDENGVIKGIEMTLNANCGISPDLSDAIVDRAMFHADNAYFLEHADIVGNRCKTNLVSNTAFRGFGGPQGMLAIEMVMDDMAYFLQQDPLVIRKRNLYAQASRNTTHYGQLVEHNKLPELMNQLEKSSDYQKRKLAIHEFNQQNLVLKKGIALTPVKFGISFTVQHLNQAGALVHIYTDGSIHLNHGGTEMGQGLLTKIAQIVAAEFSVDIQTVAVSSTRTDKVPNTSPTAASSGTDLNGKAAQAAAQIIKQRLIKFAREHYATSAENINFDNNRVIIKGEQPLDLSFADFVQQAYMARVSLSSTGFYKTPKIYYNREKAEGRPFFYFAVGAAVSEVIVDTLTGEYKFLRADILQDVGQSLNPAIDIGQIEGGFVQGLGWLTTEELVWDQQGRLASNNAATYKIPAISDIPDDFRVSLLDDAANHEQTIYNSKAVGEPPLMLALSAWSAIRNAIASLAHDQSCPALDTPATPERILMAVEQIMRQREER